MSGLGRTPMKGGEMVSLDEVVDHCWIAVEVGADPRWHINDDRIVEIIRNVIRLLALSPPLGGYGESFIIGLCRARWVETRAKP